MTSCSVCSLYVPPTNTVPVVQPNWHAQTFHRPRIRASAVCVNPWQDRIVASDFRTGPLHCLWIVPTMVRAQLLYPVLMFVMVCRTIALRVRSEALIAFEPTIYPDNPDNGGDGTRGFVSKVIASTKESGSLISWADSGQWVTVERVYQESRPRDDWSENPTDEGAWREGHRFRMGFEPLFVDFTQAGSWFMAYFLVQVQTQAYKISRGVPRHCSIVGL